MAFTMFAVLVLCVCLPTVWGSTATWPSFFDPCSFHQPGFIPENETEIVIPTPTCVKGFIYWHYPRGTLEIKYNQPKEFQLCLLDMVVGDDLTIYDKSFGKMTKLETLKNEDCIRSHGHRVILIVKAPTEWRYLAQIKFQIKF